MDGRIVTLITENEETSMKKIIIAFALLASFSASAFNANIGYPVAAARISLTGKVIANIDCSKKNVDIVDSTSDIFSRHVNKNKSVICYKDSGKYHVVFNYNKGDGIKTNIIATQPSRFLIEPNKLEAM